MKALFLDRDGVINHEIGFLHRAADVTFVHGIFDLCRTAHALGYLLIVVTNQSGIGRGLYTQAEFEALMAWIKEQFQREGVTLDAVYHCPYHPEHGVGEWKREHEDRKPAPGMLHRAARELGVDLAQSVLIGDRCSDVAAANTARLRKSFLVAGTERMPCPGEYLPIDGLGEAETWLRDHQAN